MNAQRSTVAVRHYGADPLVEELLRHWPRLLDRPSPSRPAERDESIVEAQRVALSWLG